MFALYLLLPLLASVTLAAPTQNKVDIEPRQRKHGGNRGTRVRPGATQAVAAPAPAPTSAVPAPVAPVASAPASVEAPAADVPAGTAAAVSPAPVVPATSAVANASDEAPAANPTAVSSPADTAAGATGVASSAGSATSASGSTSTGNGASAGSGPVGIGWDPLKNTGSMQTYVDAGLQWYTNWSPKPNAADYAVEFVPMVWGSGSVPEVKAAMGSWPTGTKYVLSFNERKSNHCRLG